MKAQYDHFTIEGFVCLIDHDAEGYRSVTNDIERIVREDIPHLLSPSRRLVYCDSDGTWDEVLLSFTGSTPHFAGFRSLAQDPRLRDLLELLRPSYIGEPSDDDLLTMGYRRPFKLLADGRVAAILTNHGGLHALVAAVNPFGHAEAFYYRTYEAAAQALND